MRFLSLLLFTFLISSTTIAQLPGPAAGRQMPTGRLYGKVVDSKTNKPIEYASVQLLQTKMDSATKKPKELVVAGMLTKGNGEFSLEAVPIMGASILKITVVGFKEHIEKVSFDIKPGGDMTSMLNALDKDLGNIQVDIDEKLLSNVTVTGSKPGLQLGIDRKIFNVDKNIVSAGGTAVDVMRNVPSLNVDIDGNVTMRNNAPQVFVDGRPSNLTLEQIPADAIQSVELITNPSAKFDASGGTSGILNIVLKKEKKVGYNGSLRASVDSRGKIGLGGDINIRQQKINVFANAMMNQRKSISRGTTEVDNYYTTPDVHILQKDRSQQEMMFGFVRGGVDYFMDNRNTISVSGNFVRGNFKPFSGSDIWYDSLYPTPVSSFSNRTGNAKGSFKNIGTNLSFKHNFPKAGRELTADATFNVSRNNNNNFIGTNTYDEPEHNLQSTFLQQQVVSGRSKNLILQTDFTNPITDKMKFETGVRAQIRENISDNAFYVGDNSGHYQLQAASQIAYKSNDQVYAAYANFSQSIKSFGYQLGLRAESSNYKGFFNDKGIGKEFKIDFPISLFPSIFLSQKLSETQSMQLNYSRRINRPNFWQLSPFTDSTDRLNPSKGNPGLKPEFTNSLELSYEKTFKSKGNFLASIYYKHTNDLITRFQTASKDINEKDVIVTSYINANAGFVGGLELTSRLNIKKWWEFTPNFNLYTSDTKINIPGEPDQPQLTSFFVKLNNTFKLPKNITFQLSGNYQSKTVLPPGGSGGGGGGRGGGPMFGGNTSSSQGYIRPNYAVDAAVRYEFLKNKTAAISLNVNDIFKTGRSDIYSASSNFVQNSIRYRDQQVFRLNFNWRFGKFDSNLFKRKNMKAGDGGSMDGVNMGQ